jgi:hypothetical protein
VGSFYEEGNKQISMQASRNDGTGYVMYTLYAHNEDTFYMRQAGISQS